MMPNKEQKIKTIQNSADRSKARFSHYWNKLDLDRRHLAELVTEATEWIGGRAETSKVTGIATTTLDNYRSGKTQPKALEIVKIIHLYDAARSELVQNDTNGFSEDNPLASELRHAGQLFGEQERQQSYIAPDIMHKPYVQEIVKRICDNQIKQGFVVPTKGFWYMLSMTHQFLMDEFKGEPIPEDEMEKLLTRYIDAAME